MDTQTARETDTGFSILRRFARRRATADACDLCGVALPSAHEHLVSPLTRELVCSCPACIRLLGDPAQAKFKRVPRDSRRLDTFEMSDAQWDSLGIPIGLAFFMLSSRADVTAFYPSPAGAVESLLPLDTWSDLVERNPELGTLRPDVEALLVNRVARPGRFDPSSSCFIAPIDACYRLVGLVRTHWRGFSGGDEMWRAVDDFFSALERAPRGHGARP